MEDVVGEQEAGDTLLSDMKIGEFCSSDIQVAINEGNRHRHAFFVVKMGKTGVTMPYQQIIPAYFSKYHPKLHLEDITLERPCGRWWGVTIRTFNNVCRFAKGWKQFSVENHLREGHQLLFHLVGKSRFVVHFFDHLGKSHDSFPPLTPMPEPCEKDAAPPFAKPQSESPAAKPPPLSVAKPLPRFETPVATPLETFAAAPLVHPNMSTNVASSKEMAEDMGGTKKQGNAYIFIDSDDDDEPVKQESLIRTPIRRGFVQESYSGEQTGFHSPEKIRTPRLARTTMPVRSVRKKTSTGRASWESNADHDIPTAKRDGHGHRGTSRDLHEEKITSSRNGNGRKDHGVSHFLSPAKVLLAQQGCLNYSEIVSKRRRGDVTDEARQRILTAATRFAAGLKNENFLVAMKDLHVYHGFHLSIPRDFLEATGTLRANKVRVCLMDNQRNCYETKWKWHANCQTPFLNCDGWALFALDHVLEEGDVCVFELAGPGPAFLLSVHIFKCVAEGSGRESSVRGSQSASLNQRFGRQAAAAHQELMHDRGSRKRPSVQKTIRKPYNLQAWTKLFKPRAKAQFGGRPGQR